MKRAKIVKIGNSRGLRLPKDLIELAGLNEDVILEATGDSIVIRSADAPRRNWAEQYQKMAELSDDKLLDDGGSALSSWDEEDWQW